MFNEYDLQSINSLSWKLKQFYEVKSIFYTRTTFSLNLILRNNNSTIKYQRNITHLNQK